MSSEIGQPGVSGVDRGRPARSTRWEHFVSHLYDATLWWGERRGMRARRAELLRDARGRVLEIGAGTGLNLVHYPRTVDELLLTEPTEAMVARLRRRVRLLGRAAAVLPAPATALPVEDGSVDTVVSTLVLCTVSDAAAVLTEIARVLRPGGTFLFCEHVLAETAALARWQHRLAGPWAACALGCRCDRPLLNEISRALRITRVSHTTWRGMPPLVRPLVVGAATR